MSKESESVNVIIREFSLNPKCKHGPTILFSLKNGKRFFGCSAHRKKCFYLKFETFEKNKERIMNENLKAVKKDIPKLLPNQQFYCFTCEKINSLQCHDNSKIIDVDFLEQPSLYLSQLNDDKLNAQYFFDDTTLKFFVSIFDKLQFSNIICLGSPRLHDFIRIHKKMSSMLLDIDDRFQSFYPEYFCHYNMFNHTFFNGDEEKLINFMKTSHDLENSQHCLFVDPPFAARTELLTITLRTIAQLYFKQNRKILPIFWIFPYFNELHILREMPEMEMLDFQVTYKNHNAYNQESKTRKEGSPVRVFTNISQNLIEYPDFLSNLYRYCQHCQRHVAVNNKHCNICKICPSKNGSKYRHCSECTKCVKPNYSHCLNCGRCVQITNHNCKIYQLYQECKNCGTKGHVENFCRKFKKNKI